MSQVQQIKEAINIIDVIGSRVDLQRAGSNYRGLCPFHSEKSPSFFVSDQMQRFKCFGCGEMGDVFTFLEKYEGMTFHEALQTLADQAGITLEEFRPDPNEQERTKILEVLNLAAEYYHYLLTKHKVGKDGREYLKDRKISSASITLFKIGYAQDSWDGLLKYLHRKKKYDLKILEKAGLIIPGKKPGSHYDRFRGRVMFPLRDHRGRIVGFSGRILDPDAKSAKYINSPETMVYHKSKMLFGYHELYQQIRKANEVIVTEGEMDVISSSQVHVNNVVAIKGTALTEDHAKLLGRTVDRVLLALDTDSAGVEATKKAITVLQEYPLELRVITIPSGKDLDDLARSDPKLLRQVTQRSVTAYEFLITTTVSSHDPATPGGKRAIMNELAHVISSVPHQVEKEHYMDLLAEKLGVQKSVVRADIEQTVVFGARIKPPKKKKEEQAIEKKESFNSRQRAERYVLFLLMQDEIELLQRATDLASLTIEDPVVQEVIKAIQKQGATSVQVLAQQLPQVLQDEVFSIYADPAWSKKVNSKSPTSEEWSAALSLLKQELIKDEQRRISQELHQLAEVSDKDDKTQQRELELLTKLASLNRKLQSRR